MSANPELIARLTDIARDLRRDVLEMVYDVKDGHPGPAYSVMEILTALYFGGATRFDPENPKWEDRDRIVLSKGHACPSLYAALIRLGVLDHGEKATLRKIDSRLQGHPEMSKTPGVEATTGPLGNGLAMSAGMAKALKLQGRDARVYAVTGDGELNEGIVWETFMAAAKHRLDNLCVFIDANKRQSGGPVKDVSGLLPIKEKMEAFGFAVREIDGHDFSLILESIAWAKDQNVPSAVICDTIKGKGLDYMEDDNSWHKRVPTAEQFEEGMKQLEGNR